MNRPFGKWLVLGTLLVAGSPGFAESQAAGETDPALNIIVWVYNYAQVPQRELARAEERAARIFRKAGIEADWIECLSPGKENRVNPDCVLRSEAPALVVKILPRSMAARSGFRHRTFGFSLLPEDGGPGIHSYVFYHRVKDAALHSDFSRSLILGHAMAHEIGHLLLGSGNHSGRGIMRAHWKAADLRRAARSGLLFTPKQTEKIRADLLARL